MKIIFTSCTRYEAFETQDEWQLIIDQNPDYLFLLGDSIYMDYGYRPFSKEPVGSPEGYSDAVFRERMEEKYHSQFECVPKFKELIEMMRAKNGFYAIWDDHDFAWDNAKGLEQVPKSKKDISRALFHRYTQCSTNKPHTYYHIDTPLARVIFMDNRSDAEVEGEENKLLSDDQFAFIRNKLEHNLKYTILCGGMTLTKGYENWTKYPSELKKLCELTKEKENLFFLGGDIHKNMFVKPKKIPKTNLTIPMQLISSGMQINYLGLGVPIDDKHNWAMLDIEEQSLKVNFYSKYGIQKRKSRKANKWISNDFLKEIVIATGTDKK